MGESRLHALSEQGQSVWIDSISRQWLAEGFLDKLIREDAVVGVTSNPTIFQKALAGGTWYDDQLREVLREETEPKDIFYRLAVKDIQDACDMLSPVYADTGGQDGVVSLEVSPLFAHDTEGTISEARRYELAELFQIPKEEIAVVPNGVDIQAFHRLDKQTRRYVKQLNLLDASPLLLLPVRVTPRKNLELALRVCADLLSYFPGTKLVVTGPLGPHNPANIQYFAKLSGLRRELGLESVVHFLTELADGYLPDQIISDFYHFADALFLPSREEGFGIPILEAGLAGLPVFCSDIPPLRSLGGTEATYFSPDGEPGEIAEMIAHGLSSSSVFRLRMRVRRDFSWEHIYAQKIRPLLAA